jgi:hypothetical protein
VQPGDAFFGVAINDVATQLGASRVERDVETVWKSSLNQESAHFDLSWCEPTRLKLVLLKGTGESQKLPRFDMSHTQFMVAANSGEDFLLRRRLGSVKTRIRRY